MKPHTKYVIALSAIGLSIIGLAGCNAKSDEQIDVEEADSVASAAYDRRQSVGNSPDIMKALADSMASARARIAEEIAADSLATK